MWSCSALTLSLVVGAQLAVCNVLPAVRDSSSIHTAAFHDLKTWWHNTGEINTKTPVEDTNVRQSHVYSIQVASASRPRHFYDTFVYESMPRNGNGDICSPGDLQSICPPDRADDGITIEGDIGADMAWTQYLTSRDTIVRVTRDDGGPVTAEDVLIRPTNLAFNVSVNNGAVLIKVPYSAQGHRFSVEFKDNLWEYRNSQPGSGDSIYYVQDVNPEGESYVPHYDGSMPVVGVEPLNALLIFVSPLLSPELVPNDALNTHYPEQGFVTGLENVNKSILYFAPGVYWFTAKAHAILSRQTSWVYLAPGAYVKGAFQFETYSTDIKVTGFGVVSGEQYVYQANPAEGYVNNKSDATSLKMWRFESQPNTHVIMTGITTANPVFNSMDMYLADPPPGAASYNGDAYESFRVDIWDYKQTGAWFTQTDGVEMYPGSHVRDVFYHVGDDGIKTYYSDVVCERVVVWKTNNAPIVQFGWYSRNITNVTVSDIDVIHTRYRTQNSKYPRALIGSAVSYVDDDSTQTANIFNHLSDYELTDWRCEGICPGLLGINMLQNIDTMLFDNIWIEKFAPNSTLLGTSILRLFTDGEQSNKPVALGNQSPHNLGLVIKDFYVGKKHITIDAGNWNVGSAGRLNFSESSWGRWTAV